MNSWVLALVADASSTNATMRATTDSCAVHGRGGMSQGGLSASNHRRQPAQWRPQAGAPQAAHGA